MPRSATPTLVLLSWVLAHVLFASPALAQAAPPSTDLAGFELLATVGYGASTTPVYRVELDPYGATFGLEPGYTFHNGVRLGAYAEYGVGREIAQVYDPRLGRPYDLNAAASSVHAGASVGFDLPLYMLILRYSLGVGFTREGWDFEMEESRQTVPGFGSDTKQFGAHLAPGLGVLWASRGYECGIALDYMIQFENRIPSGVRGKLLFGVRR